MQPSTRSIEFTTAEREAFEEKQRKMEAALLRMAESSREESERLAGEFFHELGAARRLQTARRVAPRLARPTRPARGTRIARSVARTTTPSRGDPTADDDPHEGPWALGFIDRAPFFWRLRSLRCRLLEIREGVER